MRALQIGLLSALLSACVFPHIGSSLWLDEAGTWWIVKDGLSDVWQRSFWWSASSPAYYLCVWASTQILGMGEIALRLPSVLCMLAAASLLYQLARNWLDSEGALMGALCFFSIPPVQFAVIDARPYALGLVLLIAAWLTMLRWVRGGHWWNGLALVACAAAAVWVHYLFILGLIPLAYYFPRLGIGRAVAAAAGIGLLVLPLAFNLAETAGRRGALSWARPPTAGEALVALGLVFLALPVALRTLSEGDGRPPPVDCSRSPEALAPLVLLAVVPPLLLLGLSWTGTLQLFVPRYMLSKEVGLALIAAWILRGIRNDTLRSAAVIAQVGLFVSIGLWGGTSHGGEGWRESSGWLNAEVAAHPETTVVVMSGFVESMQPDKLSDPAYTAILLAPQVAYPIRAQPILMPWHVDANAAARLDALVLPAARQSGRVAVVSLPLGTEYHRLLERCLAEVGLTQTQSVAFGAVEALLFQRVARPAE